MLNFLRQRDIKFRNFKQEDSVLGRSILVAVFVGILVAVLFMPLIELKKDFYNNLWAPVYLLVHRQSPYNTSSLEPALPAIWFPMAIGVFSPLGFVNELMATKIWFLFNVVELILITLFSTQVVRSVYSYFFMVFFVFMFPPVLNNFILGQFSITVVLCAILTVYCAEKGHDWFAACFLALSLTKPQLAILVIFSMSIYFFRKKGLYGVLAFGLRVMAMSLLMCIPLFVAHLNWIADCIASIRSNHGWLQPSIFSALRVGFGIKGYFIWLVIALIVLGYFYRIHELYSPRVVMAWGLALTTMISPYLWSWDFVLVLPLWIYAFSVVDTRGKYVLMVSHLVIWFAILYYESTGNEFNQVLWWIPFWMVANIMFVMNWTSISGRLAHQRNNGDSV